MKLPSLEYASPNSLDEAIALLAAHDGEAKPIAGGQSLVPMLAFRLTAPALLVDLRKVPGLADISISETGVTLGAMTRWRDILADDRLLRAHPLLLAGIGHVAHYQIRNRGTVGGSLAHADPAAELPAIAVTCEATINVAGRSGRREIAAADFFHGPLMTALKTDEIVTALKLPLWPGERRFGFREFARRRGDFALAGAALYFDRGSAGELRDVHVGALGVADKPLRLSAVERALEGQKLDAAQVAKAAAAAAGAVEPYDDIHASGAYRRHLLGVMVERALADAAASR
jgi:carbon-monoxide dehydrogenase medium subunit